MYVRSLFAALTKAVVALPFAGTTFAGDRFEWPELPYEPCFRVERVLAPTDICAQGGSAAGRAINSHGTIVGSANCGAGNSRAFIWRMNEPFQWIPTPQGTNFSWAWAINDDGLVAGSLGNGNGFAWHEGTGEFQLIPSPYGSGAISPYAINARGVIVGTILVNQPGVTLLQGFHWHDGVLTRLEELYDFGGRTHIPVDIDDEGTIVGYFPAGDGGTAEARPFLIKDGMLLEFDPFPKGWNGAAPGALLHNGVFMAECYNNPDMPSIRVAAYGNASGFLAMVGRTWSTYRRVTTNGGNAAGDSVGGGLKYDGDWETIIIRQGVLHVMRDLMLGPFSDHGTARGISTNGQVASGPRHLVPAPPPLGDLSRNCRRDLDDLPLLLGQWGIGEGPADLNDDGRVDLEDLLILLRLIAHDLSL